MKIKELTSDIEFIKGEKEFLDSPNEGTVLIVLDRTEAIYCEEGSCNTEWCDENNVPYIKQGMHNGGCIIGVKGNIFVNVKRRFPNGGECLGDRFSKAVCAYLKDKGLNSARCDNNDILVDNYKVGSCVEASVNGFQYMAFQVSIHQDIETIKHACNKPMVKIPKALSEYGITTDEMKKFFINYWNNN